MNQQLKKERILALETSCDETAVAVVLRGREVRSHFLATSADLHQKTGGIVPEIAAREQLVFILPLIEKALQKAWGRINAADIDALAVTNCPGLLGSLLVGVETARTLSWVWQKPLIPVNHLTAHLYFPWLEGLDPTFPLLGLIVSGGHTELVFWPQHGQFELLGVTRDDAAGEAFDKAAKMLGLGYPGGPAIEKEAKRGKAVVKLPRPLLKENNFDFSFSGLKTALYYFLQQNPAWAKDPLRRANLAASFQEAVVEVLVEKTFRAWEQMRTKAVVVGGGVSANQRLRQTMVQRLPVPVLFPPREWATDNAALIGACAYFNFQPCSWDQIQAVPRCP